MAKSKKWVGPIFTECTKDDSEGWTFSTGQFEWQWKEWCQDINLFTRAAPSTRWRGTIYAKSLDHAVMFAQGFEAGRHV